MEGKSLEWIVGLYDMRRNSDDERWRIEAQLVKKLFVGDLWAPVSERFGDNEFTVAANNALIHMEGMVKRIVSTQPNIKFPAIKQSQASEEKARKRRLAALGFWDQNRVDYKDRKRVRWLQGYGVGPVQIGIDTAKSMPKWTLRDPLMTYAAPANEDTGFVPDDCIFAYKRTYAWINLNFPLAAAELTQRSDQNKKPKPDTMYEVLEYVDAYERVLLLCHRDPSYTYAGPTPVKNQITIQLTRVDNRLGRVPVVAPSSINIDRIKSPYVTNVGMYIMRNKLAALEYIYAERSVFPETILVSPGGGPVGEIIEMPNGEEGIIGQVHGGTLQTTQMPPNFTGTQMIDRLEREERVSNSTPAEWSGESASNIRTNARGKAIASEAVDYTIQEVQSTLAIAKEEEMKIAIQVDRVYLNRPKSFYVGWKGSKNETVDYTPSDIWENDECHVYYPSAGTDVNNLVISGGQRIAQQTLSKEAFMELDPLVGDPELERDRIVSEQLLQSILTEMLQPGGALDVVAKARVASLVLEGKMELAEAIAQVQKERQEEQASVDQQGAPTGVDPNSPEAQPGLVEGGGAGIAGPSEGQQNLASVLGALRQPQMTVNGA